MPTGSYIWKPEDPYKHLARLRKQYENTPRWRPIKRHFMWRQYARVWKIYEEKGLVYDETE